jgi:MYXO-CTERM domain-containing protein
MNSLRVRSAGLLFALALLLPGTSAWAQLTEDFSSPANASNGATLGACQQLTVGLAAGGTVSVSGNGVAAISTPSEADSAILYSTHPLPAAGYKVQVVVKNVAYHKYTKENAVTLLAITNGQPTSGSEVGWLSRRVVGVEVDSMPDFTNDSSIFINYWDSSNTEYTWNGSQWTTAWDPYFAPQSDYVVAIEKTAGQYIITVSSGGAQLAQASVSASSVASSASEYLVVGDRLTDFTKGSMDIDSITMPSASCGGSDAGTADSWKPYIEASAEFPPGDYPSWSYDGGGLPGKPRPQEPSACDCRVAAPPAAGSPALLLLLVVAFALAVRRRRR